MKKAILYIRVSTDEQAEKGFSLQYQEERLRKYCSLNNIVVEALYKEDHSAKTFDRPEFKKLLEFAKRKRGHINFVFFINWSRFSRNAGDAYGMISKFNKLGIEPQAIEQPLDLNIPENKMMLAFYLAQPEVENDRRSLSTLAGIRGARKEGRWTNLAPLGYDNSRDEKGKGLIVPHPKEAPLIIEAFELLVKGIYTQEEVRHILVKKGLKCSKNNFHNLIHNPVYCGKIFIPAYKEEPAMFVKGLHKPLISEELFNEVQDVLNGKRRFTPVPVIRKREEFFLRGFLTCRICGRNLTASSSKGNGGKYAYYHCLKGCGERFRSNEANELFIESLQGIRANAPVLEIYYNEVLKSVFEKNKTDKSKSLNQLSEQIAKYEERIKKAQKLMLDDEIPAEEYKEIKKSYLDEIENLNKEKSNLEFMDSEYDAYLKYDISLLKRVDKFFDEAILQVKQKLIGSIFPEKLIFSEKTFRTNKVNRLVQLIILNNNELEEKNKGLSNIIITQSHQGWMTGFEPATPRTTI